MKISYPILILLLIAILLSVCFIQNISLREEDIIFTGKSQYIKLKEDRIVSQKFIATKKNLNAVKIFIRNTPDWPGEKVIFSLKNASCAETLTFQETSWNPFKFSGYTQFHFSPIVNSANTEYCIELKFTSWFESKKVPELRYTHNASTHTNIFFVDGEKKEASSLQFHAGYSASFKSVIERISFYKASFFTPNILTFLLFSTVLSGFISFVTLVFIRKEDGLNE